MGLKEGFHLQNSGNKMANEIILKNIVHFTELFIFPILSETLQFVDCFCLFCALIGCQEQG